MNRKLPVYFNRKLTVREESYTSKASSLDLEPVPNYGTADKPVFVGRRVQRGLFRTAKGIFINADVIGSANILRKEIGDRWLLEQLRVGQGVMDTPIAVNHIDRLLEAIPRICETTSKCEAA